MLGDFDLIVREMDKSPTIYALGDVHLGAIEHDKTAWETFCKKIEQDENTYVILVGDLVNNSIRSSVANPFDETIRPREQKRLMVEYLKPIKDRILCSVAGNHEQRTNKEVDQEIGYDIMSKLDIEELYRTNIAFMKLRVGLRNDGRYYQSYVFAVTHGTGGGIYTGATVNRNERFGNIIEGLDCLIVGHTHKGTITKPSKIVIDTQNNVVSMREMTVVSSVSWLNYGGYAARKMLLPATTCKPQKLRLSSDAHHHEIEVVW